IIAYFKIATIYKLVLYAWSGLGASFGPLLLISLYYKKLTRLASFMGILVGGITAGIWPLTDAYLPMKIPPLIPGFAFSVIVIYLFSIIKEKRIKT
nr:High-affinity proline transporter PutP [Candidatus Anoxychlamydiales bacterium]